MHGRRGDLRSGHETERAVCRDLDGSYIDYKFRVWLKCQGRLGSPDHQSSFARSEPKFLLPIR